MYVPNVQHSGSKCPTCGQIIKTPKYYYKSIFLYLTNKQIFTISLFYTYRPYFALLFVALLMNVFIIKELHVLLEGQNHHCLTLKDPHADCGNQVHFHANDTETECGICHFVFSPRECINIDNITIHPSVVHKLFVMGQPEFFHTRQGSPATLRGPPFSA
jgi:hypothetical protein